MFSDAGMVVPFIVELGSCLRDQHDVVGDRGLGWVTEYSFGFWCCHRWFGSDGCSELPVDEFHQMCFGVDDERV